MMDKGQLTMENAPDLSGTGGRVKRGPLKKIVIACTGSGGHLTAGLAVADSLRKRNPAMKVFFLGSVNKKGGELLSAAGYSYRQLAAVGLVSRNPFLFLYFGVSQLVSIVQALSRLVCWRPNLVLATGGYAAAGVLVAARLLGIPAIIHEQNIVPGKANRFIAPLAARILVSFPETLKYWCGRDCVFTGMPVRLLEHLQPGAARKELGLYPERLTILVMGGSKGSQKINELLLAALPGLRQFREQMQLIHLCGRGNSAMVVNAYQQMEFTCCVKDFSLAMAVNYSAADLVISRAGSSSISEILSFGLPAIFIPYPYSADKHQLKNSRSLVEQGAAMVVTEQEVNAEKLISEIGDFIREPERLEKMAARSRQLYRPGAEEKMIAEMEAVGDDLRVVPEQLAD